MLKSAAVLGFALAAAAVVPCSAAAASPCGSLTTLKLPNTTTITSATPVPAGPFVGPGSTVAVNVPAFCRVIGVSRPTSDSVINFEVWLPLQNWNGKLDHGGNGGYGGSYGTPQGFMVNGLLRGYTTTGTDMGHNAAVTPGGSFGLGHPEKIADWGHRANHVTSVAAKLVIKAFYGAAPFLSYFTGCSDGGHEALMEAQRYPDDYDGIVGGAPANFWTHQSASWVWEARAVLDEPGAMIPLAKLAVITAAAVAACPGVVAGVIDDPTRCAFDPASLLCAGADGPSCLTAPQVNAVRKIYAGARNPRTHRQIYPGLERGSEASQGLGAGSSWSILITSPQTFLGGDMFKYMLFQDPSWDFRTLDFDHDIALADRVLGPVINSTDPDLSDFQALGGKLILWHGWADPLVNPRNTINYLRSVGEGHGGGGDNDDRAARATQSFVRLFMAPGLAHCAGGPGLNTFDTLTALERWVEQGKAPDQLLASHTSLGFPDNVMLANPPAGTFSRPLCPWPQVARWTGKGAKTEAKNFVCARPEPGRDRDE